MSLNPFDIRSVILAKHAQHVVVIHFPIALFISRGCLSFVSVYCLLYADQIPSRWFATVMGGPQGVL